MLGAEPTHRHESFAFHSNPPALSHADQLAGDLFHLRSSLVMGEDVRAMVLENAGVRVKRARGADSGARRAALPIRRVLQ